MNNLIDKSSEIYNVYRCISVVQIVAKKQANACVL